MWNWVFGSVVICFWSKAENVERMSTGISKGWSNIEGIPKIVSNWDQNGIEIDQIGPSGS